jgi:hypothetical protein
MVTIEDALLTVYQQALVENKKTVTLEDQNFPVRLTPKRKLKGRFLWKRTARTRTEPRYEISLG